MRGLFSIEEGIARINTLSNELYRLVLCISTPRIERPTFSRNIEMLEMLRISEGEYFMPLKK